MSKLNVLSGEKDNVCDLLEEVDISIACMIDEISDITMEDLEHIQNLLTSVISLITKEVNDVR